MLTKRLIAVEKNFAAQYATADKTNTIKNNKGENIKLKKALRETQNLRAGCSKAAQLLDVAKRHIPQG